MNGRQAALYALTHRGSAGDARFYAETCRGARVLELGVGYGRLIPALSRVASAVVGLDLDSALLALAREQLRKLSPQCRARVSLVRGDMQRFALRQTFDRVIVPYNALYCLLTRRAALACLRTARAHLQEAGELVLDVWSADAFHRAASASGFHDDSGPIVTFRHDGQTWDVYETSSLRRSRHRIDVLYTYISRQRGTCVQIPIHQRYFTTSELFALVERAGFEAIAHYGDFTGARLTRRSEQVVLRARARS